MMLHATVPSFDSRGHHPNCTKYRKTGGPLADEKSGYVDLFCDCHTFARPKILKNGTDIAWPAGWTETQAQVWRAKNGLPRPSDESGS